LRRNLAPTNEIKKVARLVSSEQYISLSMTDRSGSQGFVCMQNMQMIGCDFFSTVSLIVRNPACALVPEHKK
jgi:hypothetical protein